MNFDCVLSYALGTFLGLLAKLPKASLRCLCQQGICLGRLCHLGQDVTDNDRTQLGRLGMELAQLAWMPTWLA